MSWAPADKCYPQGNRRSQNRQSSQSRLCRAARRGMQSVDREPLMNKRRVRAFRKSDGPASCPAGKCRRCWPASCCPKVLQITYKCGSFAANFSSLKGHQLSNRKDAQAHPRKQPTWTFTLWFVRINTVVALVARGRVQLAQPTPSCSNPVTSSAYPKESCRWMRRPSHPTPHRPCLSTMVRAFVFSLR